MAGQAAGAAGLEALGGGLFDDGGRAGTDLSGSPGAGGEAGRVKRLWSAAALLLVLLGGALWNAWYADRLSGRMAGQLEQAQELADRGDWEGAARLSRESFGLWQAHDAYLHVMMRHSDTDQILRGFRALDQYLALEESDQYTAANAELICQLELLSEMEQPSLVNIF
ncbi:MAG: DUF4363 family protein [Clostridiales bacterium]|nr:DUF4363 family protein [Clostridiales bacterium]